MTLHSKYVHTTNQHYYNNHDTAQQVCAYRAATPYSYVMPFHKLILTSPHDIKAYRGIWSIAVLTLKLSTKWIVWAGSASVCFNPGKRNPCNLLKIMLDEPRISHSVLEKTKEILPPARISSPDRPACGLITMQSMPSCPPLLSTTFNKIVLG